MVEYAVCIGLIIGTVLAASYYLQSPLKGVFFRALAVGQSPTDSPDRSGGAAGGTAASRSVETASSSGNSIGVWIAIVVAAMAPIVTTLWLVRRRRAVAEPNDGPVPMPVPKELQARFVVKRQAILHFLSAEMQQLANGQMVVRQIISTSVLTRAPQDSVHELRELMKESVIRHLLVCAPGGKLVGIVSDRDMLREGGETVGDIMTPNPITVTPDMPVSTVTTIMLAKRISCVPVVENGKLLGIVTTSDLLMALQCVLKLIEQLSLPSEVGEIETAGASVSDGPGHADERSTPHPPATPA